jgi:heptosyltransferase-2
MAGIPERIGYNKKLGFLLTKKIEDKKYLGKKHELEYNFDLLKLIGINDVFYKMYVPIEYEDKQYIDSLLMSNGISYGDKIVAINPAASCPSKRWPRDRFAKVAQYLNKNYQTKIVLICSEKNNRICKKISSYLSKRQYFISSNLKLRQLAALLQRCSLLISNDSGPVHIAVAVKTPVISIFGRNQAGLSPTRWRPLGKNDTVLHKEVGCQQCLAHNCERDFLCLKAITVEDVVNAAKKYKQNISS